MTPASEIDLHKTLAREREGSAVERLEALRREMELRVVGIQKEVALYQQEQRAALVLAKLAQDEKLATAAETIRLKHLEMNELRRQTIEDRGLFVMKGEHSALRSELERLIDGTRSELKGSLDLARQQIATNTNVLEEMKKAAATAQGRWSALAVGLTVLTIALTIMTNVAIKMLWDK